MSQIKMSARTRLKQKVADNYASFRERWLKLSPAELIDRCEELEAATRMAEKTALCRIGRRCGILAPI